MSGGIGPTGSDFILPKEQGEFGHKKSQNSSLKTNSQKASFLSFPQLKSLAIIIVLSASGMVSPEHFAFVIFSLIYMFFISKVAFPNLHSSKEPSVFNPQNKLFRLYIFTGAVIGLFLPVAYILERIFEGDKEGIKAAAPHVFLLASQVFMEGVAFSGGFSTPIRVFVPVFYNTRRIFTIVDWVRNEMYKVEEQHSGSGRRLLIGRGLAVANLGFWSFNLFGFLLPLYLPKAFKVYYSAVKQKD